MGGYGAEWMLDAVARRPWQGEPWRDTFYITAERERFVRLLEEVGLAHGDDLPPRLRDFDPDPIMRGLYDPPLPPENVRECCSVWFGCKCGKTHPRACEFGAALCPKCGPSGFTATHRPKDVRRLPSTFALFRLLTRNPFKEAKPPLSVTKGRLGEFLETRRIKDARAYFFLPFDRRVGLFRGAVLLAVPTDAAGLVGSASRGWEIQQLEAKNVRHLYEHIGAAFEAERASYDDRPTLAAALFLWAPKGKARLPRTGGYGAWYRAPKEEEDDEDKHKHEWGLILGERSHSKSGDA